MDGNKQVYIHINNKVGNNTMDLCDFSARII